MSIKVKSSFAFLVLSLFMTGCTDRVSLAEEKMREIQQQPAKGVEPLPEPKKIEDFKYSASNVRSPFVAQSLLERQQKLAEQPSVKPDENRVKEPLESFELSQLVYRGKVVAPDGQQYGLVQTPDGIVREVQVGNYMGKNHGRIVEITSTQINLIEIVEDTDAQYVEKAANIVSPS